MIIPTGHIRVISIGASGYDRGKPIKPAAIIGEPIPANIRSTQRQVYDTGSQAWVTRQGYAILVDESAEGIADAHRIAVLDSRGNAVGEYEIAENIYLAHIGATQLTI